MNRAFLDTPDGQIHYRIDGSGEPSVVLIHHTPGSSDVYRDVIPIIAQRRRVIAMDSIGLGDSDEPPRWYTIEDYAKTVIMLLDSLDIDKAVILGRHTGSKTAVEMGAAYPERVDKVVLFGPFHWKEEERQKGIAQEGRWTPGEVKADGSHLTAMWQAGRGTDPKLNHRRVLDTLKAGEETLHAGHWASAMYRQVERLPLIKCPTLIIWASKDVEQHDTINFHRNGIAEAISDCTVAEVPGATGNMSTEMPEEFARLILDFVEAKAPSIP